MNNYNYEKNEKENMKSNNTKKICWILVIASLIFMGGYRMWEVSGDDGEMFIFPTTVVSDTIVFVSQYADGTVETKSVAPDDWGKNNWKTIEEDAPKIRSEKLLAINKETAVIVREYSDETTDTHTLPRTLVDAEW